LVNILLISGNLIRFEKYIKDMEILEDWRIY